ncbi:hypothetical protein [Epilithonimonas hungarica]|uniref:DKNYY family protein n=1 Tax=Epilithonimonas hungarica TaxID=454006 RepID=A0A1G7HFX5_9FLAO|nr:hypothetical protein [Epilithonimonas hungarica]SDE99407.1 hypothetical protein SAMN05421825_0791 [Epilithonimonas hungarica]
MKTNLMAVLALSIFLLSCSRSEDTIEETTQETPFFNLKVGNEWVYKTYDRQDFTSEFKFNGQIDTVKIISQETLKNKKYYKITHSNRTQFYSDYIEYWRVNNAGHLVYLSSVNFDQGNSSDVNEYIKHPGKDYSLTFPDNGYNEYGSLIYKLYPETTLTIDDKSYKVYPFKGQFTPNEQNPDLIPKIVERNYTDGIGLVKHVSHSVRDTYNFEERLVSYNLK